VGRILKHLITQGKIKPISFYRAILKKKIPWCFHGHVVAWQRAFKAKEPFNLIQIDHLTEYFVTRLSIKHFKVTYPKSK
jgi:hypothetical protein